MLKLSTGFSACSASLVLTCSLLFLLSILLSDLLHGAICKNKSCGWGVRCALRPVSSRLRGSPTQTPVRITHVSSITHALFGMSSPQAARPPPDSQAPETWYRPALGQNKHLPTCPALQLLKGCSHFCTHPQLLGHLKSAGKWWTNNVNKFSSFCADWQWTSLHIKSLSI